MAFLDSLIVVNRNGFGNIFPDVADLEVIRQEHSAGNRDYSARMRKKLKEANDEWSRADWFRDTSMPDDSDIRVRFGLGHLITIDPTHPTRSENKRKVSIFVSLLWYRKRLLTVLRKIHGQLTSEQEV